VRFIRPQRLGIGRRYAGVPATDGCRCGTRCAPASKRRLRTRRVCLRPFNTGRSRARVAHRDHTRDVAGTAWTIPRKRLLTSDRTLASGDVDDVGWEVDWRRAGTNDGAGTSMPRRTRCSTTFGRMKPVRAGDGDSSMIVRSAFLIDPIRLVFLASRPFSGRLIDRCGCPEDPTRTSTRLYQGAERLSVLNCSINEGVYAEYWRISGHHRLKQAAIDLDRRSVSGRGAGSRPSGNSAAVRALEGRG
jgi:hypothetical protein